MKYHFIIGLAVCVASCSKTLESDSVVTSSRSDEEKGLPAIYRAPEHSIPTQVKFTNGKTLYTQLLDSVYYVEGDIALSNEQLERLRIVNSISQRAYTTPFVRHWYQGYVPYKIDGLLSTDARATIQAAISDWQNSTTLNFIQINSQNASTYPDYVEFRRSTVNNSFVGKKGGQQIINLAVFPNENVSRSATTHEIGHAIGFFHEQSRADRDNFIQLTNNIRPEMMFNFNTYVQQGVPGADLGTFDFSSIMLYPSLISDPAFVFDTNLPAMTRLNGITWGTTFVLSVGDIETANFIYGPPYARIEYDNVDNTNETSWCCSHQRTVDNVYIRLYSNEACTIPFTTPVDKACTVLYKENINGSPWSEEQTITIPANTNGIVINENLVTSDVYDEYGNITYGESRYYEKRSSFMRW